jgi:DNA-binding MarR family transcriptional regulator
MERTPEPVGAALASGAENELMDGLVQMTFAVMTILNRVGAQHELSTTQLRLLGILVDRQPKMIELAEHLGLDKSSISGLIDRAVKRGLVERVSSPDDGRSVRVALTPEGRVFAGAASEEIRKRVAKLTLHLALPEQRRLGALLVRMVTAQGLAAGVN